MGKFVIKHTKTGIKFDLKVEDKVIATSEVYTTKEACNNGIESVKKNSAIAQVENQTVENVVTQKNPKYQVFKDKAGKFRFNLTAKNGQIIAVSEAYPVLDDCLNGVSLVTENAHAAAVEELPQE